MLANTTVADAYEWKVGSMFWSQRIERNTTRQTWSLLNRAMSRLGEKNMESSGNNNTFNGFIINNLSVLTYKINYGTVHFNSFILSQHGSWQETAENIFSQHRSWQETSETNHLRVAPQPTTFKPDLNFKPVQLAVNSTSQLTISIFQQSQLDARNLSKMLKTKTLVDLEKTGSSRFLG